MTFLWALAISVAVTCAALAARVITGSGALAGFAMALCFAATPDGGAFIVFFVFVVLGSASSRVGVDRKRRLGTLQENQGRRNWLHAVANCGPAALAVLVWLACGRPAHWPIDLLASAGLAAMLADTLASEWGPLMGGRPRLITTWKSVDYGTDGAISWAGTAAALAGALLAAAARALFVGHWNDALILIVAAFGGNLVDSLLGALIEPRLGRHGGAVVNAAASTSALALASFL